MERFRRRRERADEDIFVEYEAIVDKETSNVQQGGRRLARVRQQVFSRPYVFAYGMDNSDRPCYLLWPIRGGNGQFLLVDPWSGNYFDLEAAKFVKPIGIEHFFDAFSLEKKRPLKSDAASALNIQVKDVSDSLVVNQDKAKRFELTPVWAPAEPPAKRAKTAEVRLSSASNVPRPPQSDDNEKGSSEEEDSDSSGSNSDVSSQDDSSDVSDLEKFDEAYTDFGALTQDVDPRTLERDGSTNQNEEVPGIDLPGGMKALHSLANVPKSWPLARLTIPLSAASKHLERLLEGCCNEIYVRNTNPDLQLHFVRKFAKDLVVVLAFHLAETIAALFRHVLHHPSKVLYDPETEPLFLSLFWFYPIYREMLNSFFFFLVSRTRHHSCAGHCSTKRSLCNFIQNATIPPGRNTQQKNTKPTATKQKTNNATPTTPKPKTKHLSGNRVAYFCTTYN